MKNMKTFGVRCKTILNNGRYMLAQLGKYRRGSLFARNLVIIAVLLFCLLLVNGINFYVKIQENLNRELENSNQYLLGRVQDMGVNVLKTAETIATNIAVQESTQMYVVTEDVKDAEAYELEMASFIKMYTLVYDYLDSIYISSLPHNRMTEGKGSTSLESFSDAAFLQSTENMKDVLIFSRKKKNLFPNLITIIRPVTINGSLESAEGENNITGMVSVNINAKKLGKLLHQLDTEDEKFSDIIILNQDKIVLYSAESEQIGMSARDIPVLQKCQDTASAFSYQTATSDGDVIVSAMDADYSGLTFVSVMPATNSGTMFLQTVQYILEGMIFALVGSVLAAGVIAYTSYQPIISISQILNEDLAQAETVPLKEKSGEMKFITENILKNIQKTREMEYELKERVLLLRRAMFTALQVQINPHFIYNTLENINWLAVRLSGSENHVSSSILALARLMRYSLETEGYLVSVSDELGHANEYVELLQVRYPGIFEVQWQVAPEVLSAKIIRLALQPLLENAIQHGIRPKRAKGTILIAGEKREDKIYLSVTDDGIGIEAGEMERLNTRLSEEYLLESGHVGLRNVNQRLKIIFGGSYGLQLMQRADGKQGLTVLLVVPAVEFETDMKEPEDGEALRNI